jgi:hypothetical protein
MPTCTACCVAMISTQLSAGFGRLCWEGLMVRLTGSIVLFFHHSARVHARGGRRRVFLLGSLPQYRGIHAYIYHTVRLTCPPPDPSRAARAPLVLAASVLRGTSLMILAGLPATTSYGGTSFVTTLPAPTVEPFPILTPGKMIAFPPIQQSSSIQISFPNSGPLIPSRTSGSRGCPAA